MEITIFETQIKKIRQTFKKVIDDQDAHRQPGTEGPECRGAGPV